MKKGKSLNIQAHSHLYSIQAYSSIACPKPHEILFTLLTYYQQPIHALSINNHLQVIDSGGKFAAVEAYSVKSYSIFRFS
jgi:hypothetical protein